MKSNSGNLINKINNGIESIDKLTLTKIFQQKFKLIYL